MTVARPDNPELVWRESSASLGLEDWSPFGAPHGGNGLLFRFAAASNLFFLTKRWADDQERAKRLDGGLQCPVANTRMLFLGFGVPANH